MADTDMVNSPPHYNQNRYEVIDIIEDAGLGYHLSAALKYILRCKYKDKELEDLQKAVWYINRYISIKPNVGKDLGYNAWTCSTCNKGTNLVDSNQTCEDCRNEADRHTKIMASLSQTASKALEKEGKVFVPITSKVALGAHTEAVESMPVISTSDAGDYRTHFRHTFRPNEQNEQLTLEGLVKYD